ncbi:hypothetical protein GCM10010885_14760 [Alicyclobacillus cellulosilyticus]|uniref:Uncharacterized protein n=1 Tax=Alicyclobacillus cellulosilyticus TaxID=1003997 RepID=A0A917KCA8_9BACL|nr:hypothetical protein [Alicyclobacillus cellulosilyticus]GGJ06666.1 hypothetical protein GCM10010885_14760 [Alicyclobacillus cellulosilyticus]
MRQHPFYLAAAVLFAAGLQYMLSRRLRAAARATSRAHEAQSSAGQRPGRAPDDRS